VGKEQEAMSGLNQKIQEKAKTINELEKILYQKSRYTSREFIYEKDKQETWITVDYVTALLDERLKSCSHCTNSRWRHRKHESFA
jgi:hypothetical protein